MILPPPFVPPESVFRGIGAGPGIAIGPAYVISPDKIHYRRYKLTSPAMAEKEILRYAGAREKTKAQFSAILESLPEELAGQAGIFNTYLQIISDLYLVGLTEEKIIKDLVNTETALTLTVRKFDSMISSINDIYIKSRVADLEMVAQAIIAALRDNQGQNHQFPEGSIVVAVDLSPAEVAAMLKGIVAGLVTENGTKTSHAAIVAQAIGIPTVMGARGITKRLELGDKLIVDAPEGHVIVNPDDDTTRFYQTRQYSEQAFQTEIVRSAHLPAITLDDHEVGVFANLELVEELPAIMSYGGDGIGLYRTEFFYLSQDKLPTEDELFEVYRRVVESTAPKPVTIRTLDLGADKIKAINNESSKLNQALGLRAIRFCLKNPAIFRTQLRAILRASFYGNMRIMLPMISSLEEVHQTKALLNQTRSELIREGHTLAKVIPLGLMIEVPAAVILVNELAREADFLSIGTNDLVQYSMAVDRSNPDVTDLYQPLHPAILRMIKMVTEAGKKAGLTVSVCGDMASTPFTAPILVGLGAQILSMPFPAIPVIKRFLRMSHMEEMKNLAETLLLTDSAEEANTIVQRELCERYPELFR